MVTLTLKLCDQTSLVSYSIENRSILSKIVGFELHVRLRGRYPNATNKVQHLLLSKFRKRSTVYVTVSCRKKLKVVERKARQALFLSTDSFDKLPLVE